MRESSETASPRKPVTARRVLKIREGQTNPQSLPRSARGPLGPPAGVAAVGSCVSGLLVAAKVRGLCTGLTSGQVWCGGRLPIVDLVAYTVADSGVTLGYRDADSLQELRLLLACVPA